VTCVAQIRRVFGFHLGTPATTFSGSMTHIRPSRQIAIGLVAVLCASGVQAQQVAKSGTAVKATAAKRPAVARIRAASKGPLEAIENREVNARGPFARLSEVQRDSIIENSRSLLGIKYKWAGASPERGVDCSGLVQYVFAKLGIALPHHAADLAKLGSSVAKDTSDMQPGDLLVFSRMQSKRISHVGIYVGDGMMVHASSNSKAVVETPILEYSGMKLRGVRRVIAVDSTGRSGSEPEQR